MGAHNTQKLKTRAFPKLNLSKQHRHSPIIFIADTISVWNGIHHVMMRNTDRGRRDAEKSEDCTGFLRGSPRLSVSALRGFEA
jgi:hypothetical protein